MREDLIKSAVSFLTSDKVKASDREKKVQFLKKKGLDDEEIQQAFKQAEQESTATAAQNLQQQITSNPPLPPRPAYRPIQIVYYPPPPIPRMTHRQLLRYALIVGFSAFSFTVLITSVVKQCMSRILNKIAAYQRSRYQQHTHLLARLQETLQKHSIHTTADAQKQLDNSLSKLLQVTQQVEQRESSYKSVSSSLQRFSASLTKNPSIDSRAFNSHFNFQNSGFASSYADRYQVDTNYDLIIQGIKSEIRGVKGTLLSRRNFPIVSSSSSTAQGSSIGFIPPSPTLTDPSAYHPRRGRTFRSELTSEK